MYSSNMNTPPKKRQKPDFVLADKTGPGLASF